jgi:hypothetical protein
MSAQEIEQHLPDLSPAELERIEKLPRVLRDVGEPGWAERIAEAHASMDKGKKFYEEDLLKVMAERRFAEK